MFDIGFWELSIIGIVALLVIGPERLPAVARTVGKYVGRANRFVANIKDDISKELKDEDLKRILAEQQKLADDYKNAASSMNTSINSETESLRSSVTMDDILDIEEADEKSVSTKNAQSSSSLKDSSPKYSAEKPVSDKHDASGAASKSISEAMTSGTEKT